MTYPTSTRGAPAERSPDLATIGRIVQEVSREIVLEKLIDQVLVVALEHGGAERGLLILSRDGAQSITAEATARRGTTTVRLRADLVTPVDLPDAVLGAVTRTGERVLLHDVAAGELSSDRALRERQVHSILCLPLRTEGELPGALYLEASTPHVFTPGRIEVLELLAAQAAISLRHAHLVAELREADHGARRRAEELERIIHGLPELIWTAQPDGVIDFVNRRFTEFLGVATGLPEGWDPPTFGWRTHIHPEDVDLVLAHWTTHLSRAVPYEHVFRVRRADGQYRWHLARGLPQRDDTGAVVRWYGIMFDVQDLTEAREQIQRQEHELRRLLDVVPQQIFVLGADMTNEYANKAILEYHGDMLANIPSDIDLANRMVHHPDDLQRLWDAGQQSFSQGTPLEVEARVLGKDGTYRWFLIRMNPLHDDEGRVVRWYGTRTDIDDRKKAEERVRQDERELRMVVDFVPDHLGVLDAQGNVLYANRAALEFTGLTLEEAVADPDPGAQVVHPDDLPAVRATLRGLAEGNGGEVEIRLRRRDGQYRWVLTRYVPLRDDDGRVVRWFATNTDIDDRKRAEERMQAENLALREEVDKASMFEEIVGASPSLQAVLTSVAQVAPTDSTVLLTGETGTGKELVARAIHKRSLRASRAFVGVNCAAIPSTLIASELFGHEKGAFTGALQRRPGRFELADGGTIFLDEIGDLPPDTQLSLLRVLQERQFERVGATRPMKVDVRVVAATNRDLHAAMDAGAFRADLFYRLNVFPIEMPPLRERVSDIPLLVAYFVDRYARQAGKTIRHVDKRTMDLVESYRWPGNVRELQNVIERAVIVCDSDTLAIDARWLSRETAPVPVRRLADELAARERQIIETALAESGGRVSGPSGAARKLGIPASTLESKIRALGIDKKRLKGP
jgi:formate hydrogenlyase transcriptional activator